MVSDRFTIQKQTRKLSCLYEAKWSISGTLIDKVHLQSLFHNVLNVGHNQKGKNDQQLINLSIPNYDITRNRL